LRAHATASSMSAHSKIQKPPMCSLVSRYGPSVMRTPPLGLRSQQLRGPKAASKFPDAGSHHLFVERMDFSGHRFARFGWVEVVGEVTSNKILRHTGFRIVL